MPNTFMQGFASTFRPEKFGDIIANEIERKRAADAAETLRQQRLKEAEALRQQKLQEAEAQRLANVNLINSLQSGGQFTNPPTLSQADPTTGINAPAVNPPTNFGDMINTLPNSIGNYGNPQGVQRPPTFAQKMFGADPQQSQIVAPETNPQLPKFDSYNPDQIMALRAQLSQSPEGSRALTQFDRTAALQEKAKLAAIPVTIYPADSPYVAQEDRITKQRTVLKDESGKPVVNPYYDAPEELISESFDKKTGKWMQQYGKKDYNAVNASGAGYTKSKDGSIYRKTKTTYIAPVKTGKDGMLHIDPTMNKMLDSEFQKQQRAITEYDALSKGQTLYNPDGSLRTIKKKDKDGYPVDMPYTANDAAATAASQNLKYLDMVKRNMPVKLQDWYGELWNAADSKVGKVAKKDPASDDFWAELMKAWKGGDLSPADVQYGKQLYRAIYKVDPQTLYGNKFPDMQQLQDNTQSDSHNEDQ